MEIVLATKNSKKAEEMRRLLLSAGIGVRDLNDFPDCPDVLEDADTFSGNALKKALEVARYTGCVAVADDSGLVVDALGGAPGVMSARYSGEDADDQRNNAKLLRELAGVPAGARTGRFISVIALAWPDGRSATFDGAVEGLIGMGLSGSGGFGYDTLFYPLGQDRSFGEMRPEEKDAISHRRRALDKLAIYMGQLAL